MPDLLNISGFRRKAIANKNWLKISEDEQNELAHINLLIMSFLSFLYFPQCSLQTLLMFLPIPLGQISIHTDTISNSIADNHDTKHASHRPMKIVKFYEVGVC